MNNHINEGSRLEMLIDTKYIDITDIDNRILPDILASINRRNYIDVSIFKKNTNILPIFKSEK